MKFRLWLENTKPNWLYHVSANPSEILKNGFLPPSIHKQGSVLGGSSDKEVSFTNYYNNAFNYKKGIEIISKMAKGELDIKNINIWHKIGKEFGISEDKIDSIINYVNNHYKISELLNTPNIQEHKMMTFLQLLSSYSSNNLKFPLIMGSRFPDILKIAKNIVIFKISTEAGNGKSGPQKMDYFAGEKEWRVADPQNFDYSTLEIV